MPSPPEQRLLAVTAFLLKQEEPVTWERIRDELAEFYDGTSDAAERKWTRDKKDLAAVGVSIEHVPGERGDEGGYVLRPDAYQLRDLNLTPEDAAVLWAAAMAAGRMQQNPWGRHVLTACEKLVAACRNLPPVANAIPIRHGEQADRQHTREIVDQLGEAVRRRKRITMDYFVLSRGELTKRDVDVYGFAWRRGLWLFAGHCHLRNALRVFYVDQVRSLAINARNPASQDYEIPSDFDIATFSRQQPWEFWIHDPLDAVVRFRGALAPIAAQLLPGARIEPREPGEVLAHLSRVRYLDGLARAVLSFGRDAELLSPEDGRARVRAMLDDIASRLGGGMGRPA